MYGLGTEIDFCARAITSDLRKAMIKSKRWLFTLDLKAPKLYVVGVVGKTKDGGWEGISHLYGAYQEQGIKPSRKWFNRVKINVGDPRCCNGKTRSTVSFD